MENSKYLLRNKRFLATSLQKVAKKCENSTKNTTAKISQGKGQQFEENNTESLQKNAKEIAGWIRVNENRQKDAELSELRIPQVVCYGFCETLHRFYIFPKENRIYIRGEYRQSLGMHFFSPFQLERKFKVFKSCKCSQIICSSVEDNVSTSKTEFHNR